MMPVRPICCPIHHSIPIDMTIAITMTIPINMAIPILHIPHTEPLHIRPHLGTPRRRQKIHKESQDVESEDKRHNPPQTPMRHSVYSKTSY